MKAPKSFDELAGASFEEVADEVEDFDAITPTQLDLEDD